MLEPPRDSDGGPEVFDEPLLAVHVWGEYGHDVWEAVDEAREEVAAEIREKSDVRVWGVFVFFAAVEEVLAVVVDDGDVHVATVAGQAFARLRHEAGCDAEFRAQGFDNEFEERGFVCHLLDFAKLEGLVLVSIELIEVLRRHIQLQRRPGQTLCANLRFHS